jgi:hypothetical protein
MPVTKALTRCMSGASRSFVCIRSIGLNGFAVAVRVAGAFGQIGAGELASLGRHVPVTREKDHSDDTPA